MENKLTILWTNADPVTSEFMVFMYAENSLKYKWWQEVEIIVWGATAKLVVDHKRIQEKLLDIHKKGVRVRFCISCAKKLGIEEDIKGLGFEIDKMGQPLTDVLKNNGKLLTI